MKGEFGNAGDEDDEEKPRVIQCIKIGDRNGGRIFADESGGGVLTPLIAVEVWVQSAELHGACVHTHTADTTEVSRCCLRFAELQLSTELPRSVSFHDIQ